MKKRYKIVYSNGFSNEKMMTEKEIEYAKKSMRYVMIQEIIYNDGNIQYKTIFVR